MSKRLKCMTWILLRCFHLMLYHTCISLFFSYKTCVLQASRVLGSHIRREDCHLGHHPYRVAGRVGRRQWQRRLLRLNTRNHSPYPATGTRSKTLTLWRTCKTPHRNKSVHISFPMWYNVGNGTGALWNLWDRCIGATFQCKDPLPRDYHCNDRPLWDCAIFMTGIPV